MATAASPPVRGSQVKNGFGNRLEALIRARFGERSRDFSARLLKVKEAHNRRGVLISSMTVVAMHAELQREFRESATECEKALVDTMQSRPTVLLAPRERTILRLCSDALAERRTALDAAYQEATATIVASLSNKAMIAPYRLLSDDFVQLQCENVCVELRTKKRELFWLKVQRTTKLLALVGTVVGVVAAAASLLGGLEVTEIWKSLFDRITAW